MQVLAIAFFLAAFSLALWAIGSVIREYGDRILNALVWEDTQAIEAEDQTNVLVFKHVVRRMPSPAVLDRWAA
jgi:hypothetical protein